MRKSANFRAVRARFRAKQEGDERSVQLNFAAREVAIKLAFRRHAFGGAVTT